MLRTTLTQATQYVMQKNHLVQSHPGSLETLAGQLAGLPGLPVTTPVLAARARLPTVVPSDVTGATLITSLLMRSTLYQVPRVQFVNWYAATARQRNQTFNAELRLWGIETNAEIERLGDKILGVLDHRPATIEEVNDRLPASLVRELNQTSRGGRVSTSTNVSLALRWLISSGKLVVSNAADDWWIERLVYQRLDWAYPELDLTNLPICILLFLLPSPSAFTHCFAAKAEIQSGLLGEFLKETIEPLAILHCDHRYRIGRLDGVGITIANDAFRPHDVQSVLQLARLEQPEG